MIPPLTCLFPSLRFESISPLPVCERAGSLGDSLEHFDACYAACCRPRQQGKLQACDRRQLSSQHPVLTASTELLVCGLAGS
jgi:hypothetical protein